jgi:uncharacterized protein (TIGR02145 family)
MIFTTPNAAGAFASALKFPAAGYRNYDNGLLVDVGSSGAYWSSRWDYLYSYRLFFNSGYIQEASDLRSFGFSVRCIKEYTLSTTAVSDITTTTATSGGEIISDGGAPITASGICWSTSALPTVDLATKTTDGAATGSFTSAITGLSANTVYYVRAYATNSNGTVYGKEICFKSGTEVVEVTSSSTGRIWMDRNLGADQAATSSTDDLSYGDLYQWGRINDGHQIRTSAISSTLSDTDTPGRPDFIKAPNSPYDWRSTQNDGLWQGVSGVNNPCPTGFRIPTETELVAESATFTTPDAAGAFASALKFPAAGARNNNGLVLSTVGSEGYYWTSAIVGTYSRFLYFNSSGAGMYNYWRAMGQSVRCIKE